ncbi:MAG: hypothetical protein KAW56_07895 [Candidatus Marinimicrobia bacterium]|nr:hypothetical protein [Candidatus Neomarinimicrobiota bacterium]
MDETISEADLISKKNFNPYTIDLYFEAENQRVSIFHLVIPPVNIVSEINTIIFFPCHTTLRILNERNLADILSKDKKLLNNFLDLRLSLNLHFGGNLSLEREDRNILYAFKTYLERYTQDLETKVKLEMDYPIKFRDIEETENLELRERILRKFGYENYIKEGFKEGKIRGIKYDNNVDISPFPSAIDHYTIFNHNAHRLPHQNIQIFRPSYCDKHEKLIYFWDSGIAFLQVKDSSSGKIYFLKVPHDMDSVQEAKAWTFGLKKEEYNPEIET